MADKPRLIEHAFPLGQASLDSVHEKNVRHRNISTLHIWLAWWRLAVCRAEKGEGSVNEGAKVCNIRRGYWLYAVYDCSTPSPRLGRVQNPFVYLLAKVKGSMLIAMREVLQALLGDIS